MNAIMTYLLRYLLARLFLHLIKGVVRMVCEAFYRKYSLSAQEKPSKIVSNSVQTLSSEEKPRYDIPCAGNGKWTITSTASYSTELNVEYVKSGDIEPGGDITSSMRRNPERIQIYLIVLTSDYCNVTEAVGSNISREYRQIQDERSTSPESRQVIPIFLGDILKDLPRCLKNTKGMSLANPNSKCTHILRELNRFIMNQLIKRQN